MADPQRYSQGLVTTGAGAVGMTAIVGLAYWLVRDPVFALIIAAGVILVAVVMVLLYLWYRRHMAARGSKMGDRISTAGHSNVSKAAQIAKLDAMRSEFEKGIERFRDAGRNVYTVPWYLLVGEPGGGKTAAITHAQLRMIPGLQDPLQGVGGTINMNWWFTRSAILLDTAGRLMFEEVPAGVTSEWDEFLKLLKTERTNCPVNGILLMIPAESLLRDTPEEIEKKAGRIAQQFEHIQTSLGFRFPVFVVITKSDMINGFNEFFESMVDPADQNQMLGWSNPEPLDCDFDPSAVDEHLQTVADRLKHRRLRLLGEPMTSEDGPSRRLDQVDALYNLPESLLKIAPVLRQYLETIFVAGSWSQRPLFVRGIYFTCSLQQGSPYDPDLAGAMGVSVSDLPKARVWDRKRSYFLRDVFNEKVFPEKGLVTRARHVKSFQRRRRFITLSAAILCVGTLLGLTLWTSYALEKAIGEQAKFWAERSRANGVPELVNWSANSNQAKWDNQPKELLTKLAKLPPPSVPFIFAWGSVKGEITEGHRALFDRSILLPLVKAARDKLAHETAATWGDPATNALRALADLGKQWVSVDAAVDPRARLREIDVLISYLGADVGGTTTKPSDASSSLADCQVIFSAVYGPRGVAAAEWQETSKMLAAAVHPIVRNGLQTYLVGQPEKDLKDHMDLFAKVAAAAKAFEDAAKFPALPPEGDLTLAEPLESWRSSKWTPFHRELEKRYNELQDALKAASAGKASLSEAFAKDMKELRDDRLGRYVAVIGTGEQGTSGWLPPDGIYRDDRVQYRDSYDKLVKSQSARDRDAPADLNATCLKLSRDDKSRVFEVTFDRINLVDTRFPTPRSATQPSDEELIGLIRTFATEVEKLKDPNSVDPRMAIADIPTTEAKARDVETKVALPLARHQLYLRLLAVLPRTQMDWETRAQGIAKNDSSYTHVALPGTGLDKDEEWDRRYHPKVVSAARKAMDCLGGIRDSSLTGVPDMRLLAAEANDAYTAFNTYDQSAIKYWKTDVIGKMAVSADTWAKFNDWAKNTASRPLFADSLGRVCTSIAAQRQELVGEAAGGNERVDAGEGISLADALGALPVDVWEARARLLDLDAGRLEPHLARLSATTIAGGFWKRLPEKAFAVLTPDVEKEIAQRRARIEKFKGFPLTPWKPNVQDLSTEDLATFLKDADDLAPEVAAKPVSVAGLLGKERQKLADVGSVGDVTLKWIGAARPVARALMGPAICTIKVTDAKGSADAADLFERIDLKIPGVEPSNPQNIKDRTVQYRVSIPHGPSTMVIVLGSLNRPEIATVARGNLTSRWMPLALIHTPNAVLTGQGSWHVQIPVPDQKCELGLDIQIVTKGGALPAIKDWPGAEK